MSEAEILTVTESVLWCFPLSKTSMLLYTRKTNRAGELCKKIYVVSSHFVIQNFNIFGASDRDYKNRKENQKNYHFFLRILSTKKIKKIAENTRPPVLPQPLIFYFVHFMNQKTNRQIVHFKHGAKPLFYLLFFVMIFFHIFLYQSVYTFFQDSLHKWKFYEFIPQRIFRDF